MDTKPDYPPQNDQSQSKKGECYIRAYEAILGLERRKKLGDSDLVGASLHLIHGTVVSQHPSIRGQRIDHAWVEMTQTGKSVIVDLATNPPTAMEASEWRTQIEAIEERRYTPEQARLAVENATPRPHAGPWHREPKNLP